METPIILDPVVIRRNITQDKRRKKESFMETRVSVIRGNASEILSLRHDDSKTKGVDSIHSVEAAAESARILAGELESVLAVTGPTDLITNGQQVIRVSNGDPLMGYVTGTGCTATVTIGAFLSVDKDPVSATATALAFFGLAGEVAAKNASAPGSFMIAMLDALYTITPEKLLRECKIEDCT